MQIRPWPKDLDFYSALIGNNSLMVQGPGGNTSFKNGDKMWVKASGTKLSNALENPIFATIDLKSENANESQSQLKPSIEKDFHLLIPFPYVIHTHSLRAITMGIVKDFGSKARIHPDISFVPYARPGTDLCLQIEQKVDFNRHKAAILQNHGFLTWGRTMEEAYFVVESFEKSLDSPSTADDIIIDESQKLDHPMAITPDYAVFLSPCNESEILEFTGSNLWKKQMYLVSQQAFANARTESEINYLSTSEVQDLQNWEAEKFRMASN